MPDSMKKLLALNTASNYVLMGIRILQGILITRWLYHYLGTDYYGFWSLLWAIFMWMVVFNLGFGAATQKYTAEQLYERDIGKYNSVISIIFGSYVSIAALIAVCVSAGVFFVPAMTGLTDPDKIAVCRDALLIFGLGTAVLFPLAMFSDILAGMRLIYVKNMVLMVVRVGEALGVLTIIWLDGGFLGIVAYSVGINIFFNLLMWGMVKRRIGGFSLRIHFDRQVFREIYNFSAFAYLNSIANLVIAKTDRFVLGAVLGLPAVSSYQIGTRLPEISQTLSSQFMDNVVPVSANLIHSGDRDGLRQILLSGMRFSAFVAAGAGILFYALTPQTIRCLFEVNDAEAFAVCRWAMIAAFVVVAVRGVPSKYLLMAGNHKYISVLTMIQAAISIALSIVLCRQMGILGVVFGALIPSAVFSLCFVLPKSMRSLGLGWDAVVSIFIKPLLVAVPTYFICTGMVQWMGQAADRFFPLTGIYVAGGAFYLAASWFFVLTSRERQFVYAKIPFLKSRI